MSTGQTGKHKYLSRFIPIHHLCDFLSENQVQIMLQIYCLTGCDTTSGPGCDTTFGLFSEGHMDGRMYG